MNQAQAQAKNAYQTNQVVTASPKKLLIMLYDGAIKNLRLAELSLEEKNVENVNKYLIKAQDIITEFMTTLNFEDGGDVARNLYQLYEYMNRRLIRANIDKDAELVREVRKYLEELRDTWTQI
ncbi:MAG: flagellar export chaperone FliS [Bacilli bacterium]|nr:flagellar export chaperone FliS [Bacilli bacterium]